MNRLLALLTAGPGGIVSILSFTIWLTICCNGSEIRVIGVVGNSGVSGESLLPVQTKTSVGGLAWDEENKRFWSCDVCSELLSISRNGRLISRVPLPGMDADSHKEHRCRLCVANKNLFVFLPDHKKLLRLDLTAGTGATPQEVELDSKLFDWTQTTTMAGTPLEGKLILASGKTIISFDPVKEEWKKLFELDSDVLAGGLGVSGRKLIYTATANGVVSFHADGTLVNRNDKVSGAIHAGQDYVIVVPAQGVPHILSWELLESDVRLPAALPDSSRWQQIQHLEKHTWCFKTSSGSFYVGNFRARDIKWRRRYGSLGQVVALGLNTEGHIFALLSTTPQVRYGGIIAWNWNSGALDPPHFHQNMKVFAPVAASLVTGPNGNLWGTYNSGGTGLDDIGLWGFILASGEIAKFKMRGKRPPAPIALATSGAKLFFLSQNDAFVFHGAVPMQTTRALSIDTLRWINENPLQSPMSIAYWRKSILLVADNSGIHFLNLKAQGLTHTETLKQLGENDALGSVLHLAVCGDYLFVSDTEHQRLLVFALPNRELVATLGKKDTPGKQKLLNKPSLLSVQGNFIALYDEGNGRILKIYFQP